MGREKKEFKKKIIDCLNKRVLFTKHALSQMLLPQRVISVEEVIEVIIKGEIIEDYPKDKRGHSCLIMGYTRKNRCIHVVCAPKEECLVIITAYIPNPDEWINFKRRKRK